MSSGAIINDDFVILAFVGLLRYQRVSDRQLI